MYKCELCNTILQERNKTKHDHSKKHKCFSDLIWNRYVIKKVEVINFKDVFNPYFIEHKRKFNFSTVQTTLSFEGKNILNHKINVADYVTYNTESENYTTDTTEPASDFWHKVISIYYGHNCSLEVIPEKEIICISHPKKITRQHYLEQPKSMLCLKLIRRFHESTSQDFEYNWLPESCKKLWVDFTFQIFNSTNFNF